MKIGLLSDTRIPGVASEVPPQVTRAFEGVDLILHAGGIQASYVLDWLEQIAPVKAVGRIQGRQFETANAFSMETGDNRVAERHILELEGHTVGMVNSLDLHELNDDVFPGFIAARALRRARCQEWWKASSAPLWALLSSGAPLSPWLRSTRACCS